MDFTFGIITDGNNTDRINKIVNSIESMKIDNYEIILIGGREIRRAKTTTIEYTDYTTPTKISEKKNLITDNSKFENIVYLHDYIEFIPGWYNGFLEFGNDFQVCVTPIININGERYRDWCLWEDDSTQYVSNKNYLIPYDMTHLSKMMYISGAYWVAKKSFMLKNRLNDNLRWGQGEDVEWSIRARNLTNFKINTLSSVKLMKEKDRIFNETTHEENCRLQEITEFKNTNSYNNLIKNHLSQWITLE